MFKSKKNQEEAESCKKSEQDELKDVHRRLDNVERRVDFLEKQRQVMGRKFASS